MIERLHPLTIFIYFLTVSMLPAFSRNPILHLLCLVTGFIMLFTWAQVKNILKKIPFFLLFFLIISLFNPFFYHNGDTVLFYVAGRRFSLEALLFGADSALMVTGVGLWFISLSHYMTSEKVLLLFGSISAKASTIISLVMRIIPHYSRYIKSYRKHQRLLGLYGDGSFLETVKAEGKIFAGFLTWSLEHSMTTADSMTARGYGVGKRKSFKINRFRKIDFIVCFLSLCLAVFLGIVLGKGYFYTDYYPTVKMPAMSTVPTVSGVVYITISLLLTINHFIKANYGFSKDKQS